MDRRQHDGHRVVACTTSGAARVQARWYLDASGTARAFSRAMNIPVTVYGRTKVCRYPRFDALLASAPALTIERTRFSRM